MNRSYKFAVRTVLVQNNDVEHGIRVLNRIIGREGILADARRIMRFEKPCRARKRINYETCLAIIQEDTTRKVNFLLRKNRATPYPGC